MEINQETMAVLKNYATINSNFVFKEGEYLSTIAEAKNILSVYKLDTPFEKEVGIYDMPQFLSACGLVKNPRFEFEDGYVNIKSESGLQSIKYYFSEPEHLTHPNEKLIENAMDMEAPLVSFDLSHEDLSSLRQAASVLGHTDLIITKSPEQSNISLSVSDTENNTANNFSIDVSGTTDLQEFNFVVNIANFKILPGETYQVNILEKLFANITRGDLSYWIALEKSKSTFTK